MTRELAIVTKLGMAAITAEDMRPLIGQTFVFERPGGQTPASTAELELLEVVSHPQVMQVESARPEGWTRQRVPFSMLFVLKNGFAPLAPALHRLRFDGFEAEEWFLSRVSVPRRDQTKAYYEAIFA